MALAVRNVLVIYVVVLGTARVGAFGRVALATNEVMRQTYVVSIQCMGALDISAQALVAAHLGRVSACVFLCMRAPACWLGRSQCMAPCSCSSPFHLPTLERARLAAMRKTSNARLHGRCTIALRSRGRVRDGA